jgi:response regulator of citrate/malate metabolism
MRDSTILIVTKDDQFLTLLQRQIHDHVPAGSRMFLAATVDQACTILKTARPRLIVVDWTCDNRRYGPLDRLLWTTTVQARQIPVVVIAERYRIDQATMMYRMGVSEYVSRTHHLDQLGPVLSAYLPSPAIAIPAVTSSEEGQPAKAWRLNRRSGAVASQAV